MTKPPVAFAVEGLADLQKELRAVDKQLPRDLRLANKAAAEVVATEARRLAPVRTGRLRNSIKAQAGQREAFVKIGTPARTPYAGPIVGGHGHKGRRRSRKQGGYIVPNPFPFTAFKRKFKQVQSVYGRKIDALTKRL